MVECEVPVRRLREEWKGFGSGPEIVLSAVPKGEQSWPRTCSSGAFRKSQRITVKAVFDDRKSLQRRK